MPAPRRRNGRRGRRSTVELKAPGAVGIWHETYLVERAESMYAAHGTIGAGRGHRRRSGGSPRGSGEGSTGARQGGLRETYPVAVTAPEPGWYADPAGVAQNFRWWDGATWTRWLSSDPTSTPPRIGAVYDVQPAAPAPASGRRRLFFFF